MRSWSCWKQAMPLGAVLCRFFAGRAIWGSSLLLLIVFADLMYADRTREKGKLEQVPRGH